MFGQEAAVSARARGRAPLSRSLMCLSMWTLLHRLDSQGSRNLGAGVRTGVAAGVRTGVITSITTGGGKKSKWVASWVSERVSELVSKVVSEVVSG